MAEMTIRICIRGSDGQIADAQLDCLLSDFAGVLPSIGDSYLAPGVLQGKDRSLPSNRQIWTVVGRMFNPRDNANYVALIVEERAPNPEEFSLLPGG
jgi:hypothetical protein